MSDPSELERLEALVAQQAAEMAAMRKELAKGEARKKILKQLNELLDEQLFQAHLVGEIARIAYSYTDLERLMGSIFELLARVLPDTWFALVVNTVPERRTFRYGTIAPEVAELISSAIASLATGVLLEDPRGVVTPIRTDKHTLGILITPPSDDPKSVDLLELITFQLALPLERALFISQLQAADKAKDEFLRTISHELRTPLNIMKGYAYLLQAQPAISTAPKPAEWVQLIHDGATHMEGLVADLLDYSAIMAGRFSLVRKPIALPEVAQRIATQMAPLLDQKGQSLRLKVPELLVLADEKRLVQVLHNLISNAIKYTPEGTAIILHATSCGQCVRVAVRDEGPGIRPEDLSRLFKAFSRLESTQTAGGIGLGLTISKGIVEASGGEIGVKSQLGSGSTFWFTMPSASLSS